MRVKDKRGEEIVLPETLKIIIAVLCVFLLIYLAVSLYSMFTGKTETAQAKETLKQIVAKINDLDEGEAMRYSIIAPKGEWSFIYYSNKLCICSHKELLGGKEDCCNVVYLGIKESMTIDSMCSFSKGKTFDNCISFRDVPLNIDLSRFGGIVSIKTEDSVKVSNLLNELLEFKVDGGKTFENLVQEFVNKPSDQALIKQIKSGLNGFFSSRKENIQFQVVEVSEDRIIFQHFLREGEEIISNLERYTFYQYFLDKKVTFKDSSGKEYLIILKIGEWKIISGPGGVTGGLKN